MGSSDDENSEKWEFVFDDSSSGQSTSIDDVSSCRPISIFNYYVISNSSASIISASFASICGLGGVCHELRIDQEIV